MDFFTNFLFCFFVCFLSEVHTKTVRLQTLGHEIWLQLYQL